MSDAARRQATRERYQTVLRTIAHQTTDRQLPGVRQATLRVHLCDHGRYDVEPIERSIQAAVENGDALRWRDRDGNVRVTLRTEPDLKRLAQHVGEVLQDPEQLARVNQALASVREVADKE